MPERPREQRRFPRAPAEKALLVKKVGYDTSEALAKTRTVGGGGCSFVHHERLGAGSAIELLISLPARVVKVQGRVAWERVTGPETVEVGVELTNVSPKDRSALARALALEVGATG